MNYTPRSRERTTGQCCRHHCHRSVVVDIVRAERARQLSSGRLVVAHASRLAEAEWTACCTTMGTRRSSLFLAILPPLLPPYLSPTTLVTITLAALTLFFTIVAIARPPPSSPLPSPSPPSSSLPSSSTTPCCCSSPPADMLVSTARLQHSRC